MGLYYNSGRYVGRKILLYEDKRKMNTLITEHSSSTDSSLESPYGSDVGDVVIGQKRVGATNVVRRTRAKTNLPVILKATKSLGSVLTENGQKMWFNPKNRYVCTICSRRLSSDAFKKACISCP